MTSMDFQKSATEANSLANKNPGDLSPEKLDLRLLTLLEDKIDKFPGKKIHVVGTSSYTLAAIAATSYNPWDLWRPRLLIVPTDDEIPQLLECLQFFSPEQRPIVLPGFDVSPYSSLYPNPRLSAQRVRWLAAAQNSRPGQIFVASTLSLLQKTIPFARLAESTFTIKKGDSLDESFFRRLDSLGYHSSSLVDDIGAYSRRGGIVDIFSAALALPIRCELFGDEIESIKCFEPDSQRSLDGELESVIVLPPREIIYSEDDIQNIVSRYRETIGNREVDKSELEATLYSLSQQQYFPGIEFLISQFYPKAETPLDHFCGPLTVMSLDSLDIARVHDLHWESMRVDVIDAAPQAIRPLPEHNYIRLENMHWPNESHDIVFSKIFLAEAGLGDETEPSSIIEYSAPDMAEFRSQAVALLSKPDEQATYVGEKFSKLKTEGYSLFICTHSRSSANRLSLFLENSGMDPEILEIVHIPWSALIADQEAGAGKLHIFVGPYPQTVKSNIDKIIFLRDSDFWGTRRGRKEYKKEGTLAQRANAITFGDLKPGDFVVHKLHGIGVYDGLKTMPIQGIPTEMIHLRYKDKDSLYLPVYRIGQIQKYSGPAHGNLIEKLGGPGWDKTKTKVRKHLRDMALDLLQLYAKRAQITRPPLDICDRDFFAFENAFPYEETEDQLKIIEEIQGDLKSDKPMDRLICGDVGFGKTEVAMRAAFLAVSGGKQVGVIAPTTVLTFQHFQTFRKRFKDWPFVIKALNRFVPPKEIKATLRELSEGKVDIVIGTHRLLSKDIKFKDLGLLVVDEEQKFGVKHKESLRKLKSNVDTLALSATPIPRTLHMSLVGIRDLSLLNTAPVDRLPTRTFVCKFDKETIRKAILSEVGRGGQVFFIHNRVQSIYALGDELRQLVPEVRIAIAHGQMDEGELEQTMIRFFNHELDLLLCTTIIESGMDIPRANTMFIDRADTFGLSQLYQLRGRVGRSKERAYCYLMIPPNRRLDPDAQERLRVLQENTALGSGIRIAHYDLELRGAGDLLGQEQSGHINAVGYEFYMELLDEAVRAAKGEPEKETDLEPEINVRIPAYIPDKYVPDIRVRLYYYKALTEIQNPDDLERLEEELRDQFGKPPVEILNLLGIMLIRAMCRTLGIRDISSGTKRISLAFTEKTTLPVNRVLELTARENKKFSLTPDSRLIIRMNDITWPGIYEELLLLQKMCPKPVSH